MAKSKHIEYFIVDEVDRTKFEHLYRSSFAIDSVNKFDTAFSLSSKELKAVLEENDFQTTLNKLGYDLSYAGSTFALFVLKHKGKTYIDYGRVMNYVEVVRELREVYLYTDEIHNLVVEQNKTEEVDIYIRWYFNENGVVVKEKGYYDLSNNWEYLDLTEYDLPFIPVKIMKNNAFGSPDLLNEARGLIAQMSERVEGLNAEWQKAKLTMAFNKGINPTQDGKDYEAKIITDGNHTLAVDDIDGVVANSMSQIGGVTTTVDLLQRLYGFYDSKIRETCHQFRDHGNEQRKSDFDLVQYNQKAYEHMLNKLKFRTRQLQAFMDMLANILGVPTGKLTIPLTEFEDFRSKHLMSKIETEMAQAEQARGIALKNSQEAELLKVSVKEKQDQIAAGLHLQEKPAGVSPISKSQPVVKEVTNV